MSFVRTLVLIAVAAGLGAWIWMVELPNSIREAKGDLLMDIEPADVASLRLAYPDGTSIAVERDGDKWKLTEPVDYAADGNVVENFLTTIKETKIERRLSKEESGELSTYGLEGERGSQARLEVTLKGGKVLPPIVIGIATPVGFQAFARREGEDEILLIPLLLQSSAKKNPVELRAKTMFATDGSGINHVTIKKPDETIELERRGEGRWAMLSPVADAADNESVRSMLDSLATIDALSFYDGAQVDRAAFGLEDGAATSFSATNDDGSHIDFLVGKETADPPAGNYFERHSDKQVIKAPDWVARKFVPAAAELRERRLLSCKVNEILSMTWSRGAEGFTISREAAGKPWTITPEVQGEVLNQRVVDNAVDGLALARADEVVGDSTGYDDLHQWGLDLPLARLDVRGTTGNCASLSGAPVIDAPAAEGQPAKAPSPVKYFYVKNADRTAVMKASEHEYSRIAMKRPEFVDAVKKEASGDTLGEGSADSE